MNKIKRLCSVAIILALALSLCFTGAFAANADEESEGAAYYVALSTQNYAVKNANKLTLAEDGYYYLNKISLSSDVKFYVTDNAGVRYYSYRGDELTVDEAKSCDYDIKFSPARTFDEEEGGYAATRCHVTYAFYTPAEYSVRVVKGEAEEHITLTYNPYFSEYELYYASSIYVEGGSGIVYGEETHSVPDSGNYRVLFTPSVESEGKVYAFNSDGEYGSGEEYVYNLFIEDAPAYYAVLEEGADNLSEGNTPQTINGKQAYPLSRYEKNVSSEEYRLSELFVSERDAALKFNIYELEPTGNFRLIDSDNDEDTDVTKITVDDAGWYELSFSVNADVYSVYAVWSERTFDGYYIVGDFNGYGFNSTGGVDLDEKFAFSPVEDGDDDYNEDYDQYILYFTVTSKDVASGEVEFYISDGENKYKNGGEYIALNAAGRYKILFSDEHVYSQGRYYRYTLLEQTEKGGEIEISTVAQFNDFAKKCSQSADYSVNLSVYLLCDLDFAGQSFTPVKSFSGKFYGGYHSLKNISLSGEDASAFKTVTRYGRVERLTVENLSIDAKDKEYVGFIGKNYGTVQRVTVYGAVLGDNYVGGVAAYNGLSRIDDSSATIDSNDVVQKGVCENCVNYARVTGKSNVGGVVGLNSGEMLSCTNKGTVEPYTQTKVTLTNIGGIAGFSAGKAADCANYGKVGLKSYGLYVGGVIGFGTGDNYFCVNHGEVCGLKYVGGVTGGYGNVNQDEDDRNNQYGGLDYETIIKNYFSGDQSQEQVLTGDKHGQQYLQNYGSVTADSYVAGVLGNSDYEELIIYNSLSTGDITALSGGYAGGILGNGAITVIGCFSSGTVKADGASANYAGGIAGSVSTVECCMSSATVIGEDYAGGIAGIVENYINSSYTNCIVISLEENANVGLIAGGADSYNQSLHSFAEEFAYNYYVGTLGGIGRTEYAGQFDYAAAAISEDRLISEGGLSAYLNEFFNHEYWQGGDANSYPVLTYMLECFETDDVEDEEEMFAHHAENLKKTMYDTAKLYYTVVFMEWNKDNGELYDDEQLQYENFDVISSLRVERGASVDAVALKYAQLNGGTWIYEGSDKVYSVTLDSPANVQGNTVVYAAYTEMISTISTPDGQVLIEGLFDARTQVSLVRTGEYVKFEFSIDGQKVEADAFKVKFLKPSADLSYAVYSAADGLELVESTEYGDYICFEGNDGYFKIVQVKGAALTATETALIACLAAVVGVCLVTVTVVLVRRSRAKKRASVESEE
ncbi:MAG: hypothetical protein ACI4L9_03965 [Candidatus Coproplasma sp.]